MGIFGNFFLKKELHLIEFELNWDIKDVNRRLEIWRIFGKSFFGKRVFLKNYIYELNYYRNIV